MKIAATVRKVRRKAASEREMKGEADAQGTMRWIDLSTSHSLEGLTLRLYLTTA